MKLKKLIIFLMALMAGSAASHALWFDDNWEMCPFNRSWIFDKNLHMHFRVISEPQKEVKIISMKKECGMDGLNSQFVKNLHIPETVDVDGVGYKVTTLGYECIQTVDEVYLPSTVWLVEPGNFFGVFKVLSLNEGLRVIKDDCIRSCEIDKLEFPSTLQLIGDRCVSSCDISEIVWPTALQHIGVKSFSYNRNLKQARIPDSVEIIGESSFYDNPALEEVWLPRGVESVTDCFNKCPNIKKIVCHGNELPYGISNCFSDVDKSTCVVVVPKGMTEKYRADENWSQFKNIVEEEQENDVFLSATKSFSSSRIYDEGLNMHFRVVSEALKEAKTVSYKTESGMDGLNSQSVEDVHIPATIDVDGTQYNVTTLGYNSIKTVDEVYLPSTVWLVEPFNFHGVSSVLSLNEGLRMVSDDCFVRCEPDRLGFPSTLQYIGDRCVWLCNMSEIEWPSALQHIGARSFCSNPNLKQARIPDSVETIGEESFYDNPALEEVWLPREAGFITNCFNECSNIKKIVCHGDKFPYSITNCFSKVNKMECVVVVPKGMAGKYRMDEEWRQFRKIVEEGQENAIPELTVTPDNEQSLYYSIDGLSIPDGEQGDGGKIVIRKTGSKVKKVIVR